MRFAKKKLQSKVKIPKILSDKIKVIPENNLKYVFKIKEY